MKHLIKLMLLAALAFPTWPNAAAQTSKPATKATSQQVQKASMQDVSEVCELGVCLDDAKKTPSATTQAAPRSNAPSKAPGGPSKTRVRNFHYATVADGNITSQYVPIYGYYYDNNSGTGESNQTVSQMIYPAQMLADAGMTGKTIRGITFYAPDGIKFSTANGDGKLKCTIGRTNTSAFNGSSISAPSTTISTTLVPKKGDTELVFEFDDGLTCTDGYNIWVEVRVTTAGTAESSNGQTTFVGVAQTTNTSYNYCNTSYSSRTGNRQFLPKATFKLLDSRNFYTIDNEKLDFGPIQCGSTSDPQTVTITNNQSIAVPLSWEFKGTYANNFSTTVDEDELTTLPAGESVTFPIVYKPGATTGTMISSFRVYLENTDFHIDLRGKGVKNYDASVSPTSLDFGEVLVNENGTATVTLTNTGSLDFTPLTTTPDNAAFTVASTGTGSLASGKPRDFVITFNPTTAQAYTGSFYFKDETNNVNLKVNLKGCGVSTAAPYVVEQVGQSGNTDPEITVCEGSDNQVYVPIYGYYADYGTEGQMIYPNTLLGLNSGDKITSITFYANENLSDPYGTTDYPVKVKIGTTSQTTLSSLITEGLTQVCSTSLWSGTNSVTFTFNSPYEYVSDNNSGNLLIDLSCYPTASNGKWKTINWKGVESSGSSYYKRLNSDRETTGGSGTIDYLPQIKLTIERAPQPAPEMVRAEEVAWGNKNADAFHSKNVIIYNPNTDAVTANLTTTAPFYFGTDKSTAKSSVSLPAGQSTQTLYFNPTAAAAYTGHLTIKVGEHSSSTRLAGVGLKDGEIATRDSAFYASLEPYTWTDSDGRTHSSKLTEIATDPDQIIAMLTEVYTNKDLPGNWKRGYSTTSGGADIWDDVHYTGVGTIKHTGDDYTTGYEWEDGYGWNIRGNVEYHYNSDKQIHYAHMDSTQYKPYQEGLTLLLVEMRDEFDINDYVTVRDASYDNTKEQLRATIEYAFKSVRVINDAKRTGEGTANAGTLFKIDCDKLNKFCIIAKGQLRYPFNSNRVFNDGGFNFGRTFCRMPLYAYSESLNYLGDSNNGHGGFLDYNCFGPLYHMFEQFSPYDLETLDAVTDVYQALVNMESYFVPHDCASIPTVVPDGHHFRMYGEDSEAKDCQDVRDLMFFVPDYRMLKYDGRDTGNGTNSSGNSYTDQTVKYLNYNTEHQPSMALYVIHQDPVEGEKVTNKDLYQLNLTWKSNMDEFLPRDKQEYQLYQLVTDDFGDETWVPVYERDNQGRYKTASGEWVTDTIGQILVPVTLTKDALTSTTDRHNYPDVYIDQEPGGRTVTFAVKGQDEDHFLSLQMSNEESFFIPGTDATEILHLTSATYYSRFEPQGVRNCYSNKIEVRSNDRGVHPDYFGAGDGSLFSINRTWYEQVGDQTVPHTTTVATATVVDQHRHLAVRVDNTTQSPVSLFPKGRNDGDDAARAGYHANVNNGDEYWVEIDYNKSGSEGYANFNFIIWDNFVVDVSKNDHPGQYVYEVKFITNGNISGTSSNQAHSNAFNIPVHKTDSRISAPRTLAEVLDDNNINPDLSPSDVAFDEQVKYSSKQNILRYDAYRWEEGETRYIIDNVYGDDDEQDIAPTGIAGNQGESYTVTMNATGTEDYYVGDPVAVSTANTTNWASFVDYYPTNQDTEAGSYVYAPVIELFTKGYKVGSTTEKREDYNTYGGPLQNTAVGKLKVTPYQPTESKPLMSDYWWEGNGKTGMQSTGTLGEKYSYYNIFLNYEALDVPEGYELYKLRAWRKVDQNILGEELATRRAVRIGNIDENGWYLYEDINFGDPLTENGTATMKRDNLYDGEETVMLLGERSAKIARPQDPDATGDAQPLFEPEPGTGANGVGHEEAVQGEMRATFGARRLDLGSGDNFEDNDFQLLEAKFKVRAYFTRKSNPLIAGKSGYDPIYVVGSNGTSWDNNAALATLYTNDGVTYTGNLTLPDANNGKGYFSFATSLPADGDNRFGGEAAEGQNKVVGDADYGQPLTLKYWANSSRAFEMPAGTYNLSVNLIPRASSVDNNAGTVTITKGALRAPRREAQMTGSDYDYYVAESDEITFSQEGGSGVITGISAVKQDVNREVVGVSYVNTIGQVSSTPWQGVNMVVTRYSDGSTTTKKVIK